MTFKQADRTEVDGKVGVTRAGETLILNVTHQGEEQSVTMTEYNAARAFGMLAVFLGIKLPTALGKAIKL